MSETEVNLVVNERQPGRVHVKTTPEGRQTFDVFVTSQQMSDIVRHALHIHEEYPDLEPFKAIQRAMKIVLF